MCVCSVLSGAKSNKWRPGVIFFRRIDDVAQRGVLQGRQLMKITIGVLVALIAAASLSACSNGTNGATAPTPPPAAAITGIDTPKSVSVVTAN
jgi:hypothetical protein